MNNIDTIIKPGAKPICLVTKIVGADDITQMVQNLNQVIKKL